MIPGMPNLLSSSSFHCGINSFGQTTRNFEILFRDISSLATSPALMVFPSPTSSASKVTGKRRQKVIKFCDLVMVGLDVVAPLVLGF